MKAMMVVAPEWFLEERRRKGVDQWDEMWEGVLHMPPMPNRAHQDLEGCMETWLRHFWVPISGGKCYHQINVASYGGWPDDYRIPDVVLLTPDRFHIDRNEYFEGGPTVVVEIRSRGDESYEKFGFYASLDVLEIWVIDRDTRRPEIHRLQGSSYIEIPPDSAGHLPSTVTNVRLWISPEGELAMQLGSDPATLRELPY
jgi:Uma2 family endonuclease